MLVLRKMKNNPVQLWVKYVSGAGYNREMESVSLHPETSQSWHSWNLVQFTQSCCYIKCKAIAISLHQKKTISTDEEKNVLE